MKKTLLLISILFLIIGCTETKKSVNKVKTKTTAKKQTSKNLNKKKVGKNSYKELVERTKKYTLNLDFDLDYIRKKGYPDKKHLAEFLGMFWKLNKALKSKEDKALLHKKLQPYYEATLKKEYHNMDKVDDKMFKKNSMSYMRIMWLLKELGFDISLHKKELAKIQKRMDTHMKSRGLWQKAVFDKYYDFFNIKKPETLKKAKELKGAIGLKKKIDYYKRRQAYVLTHFVFAAYDYGNKHKQTRFNDEDLAYLREILPQIIAKFEAMNNDDLVGELLTCQVLIGDTHGNSFKKSYKRLLKRQNLDGSFGAYEKLRKKYKNDVEIKYYLHTTLVCFETFVEFEDRRSIFN